MRNATDSLQDILDAIAAVERFTANVSFDEFAQNDEKIFAVEKAIEIMGEAVKNVPDSLKKSYPEIPWKSIAGMRDKLAHQYWQIDVEVIWKTVKNDLPIVKRMILEILTELP